MSKKRGILKISFTLIALTWTTLMILFFAIRTYQNRSEIATLATIEAQTSAKKDFAFRQWVASHGGVYVPITATTPPNRYLKIPNRDVNTTDGRQLTLMNPAYSLRQMMESYGSLYGVKSHLTSDKLLNPHNAPDSWERKALRIIRTTRREFSEIQIVGDQKAMRLMMPFFMEKSCMKCHEEMGYHVGDLRGGVSISVPMRRYEEIADRANYLNGAIFAAIWLTGLLGIRWGYRFSRHRIDEKIALYEQNIFSLINAIEQRDSYTAGHGRRVGEYARLTALCMGLSPADQDNLYRAGMLHDIGKISIPDSILLKPGRLSGPEKKLVEEHVSASYDLLKRVDIFAEIAEIIRHHHERLDGSGYPEQMRGDDFPLLSQILAVADCFDAMTTNRIYKGRKSQIAALAELASMRDRLFRADVVDAAVEALKAITIEESSSQRPSTPLEMERFSYFYKDALTGLYSAGYLNFLFLEPDFSDYRQVWLVSLSKFDRVNKTFGWDTGDRILARYAQTLQQLYPDMPIIRYQGDDFVIFHKDHPVPDIAQLSPGWLEPYGLGITLDVMMLDNITLADVNDLAALIQSHTRHHTE